MKQQENAVPSCSKLGLLFALSATSIGSAAVITVDDDGPADFADIQSAIAAATDGDTILVAPGIYAGESPTDNVVDLQGKAITLQSFNGPETTIIDGGNQNRGIFVANDEGPDTIIDGFTITNCRKGEGAGAHVSFASPTIRNCIIRDNAGEGVYLVSSSANLSDCLIQGNRDAFGAGVRGIDSNPAILDCQFIDNWGLTDGGGLHFANCSGSIEDCIFTLNRAGTTIEGAGDGGGACISVNSTTTISGCTFTQNNANADGGGLYYLSPSATLTLRECIFSQNSAAGYAAASISTFDCSVLDCIVTENDAGTNLRTVFTASADNVCVVQNCRFEGNTAVEKEGLGFAITAIGPQVEVKECVFAGNQISGLGIAAFAEGTATVEHCQFNDNDAYGYGICQPYGLGQCFIRECEFANNQGLMILTQTQVDIESCEFRNNSSEYDRLFSILSENARLTHHDNIFCGNSAPVGEGEDLGGNCVTASCDDSDGDGRPDLCDQQVDIQALIEQADEGETIVIPAGTHLINRTLDTLGKAITIRGEFDADGNPLTVLDGQGVMRILRCRSLETNNTVFDGLVFNDGRDYYWGGGLVINWAAPRFENCVISNCRSTLGGGGVCVYQPTNATEAPVFNNCRFINNSTAGDGGGMSVIYSGDRVQIDNCLFEGNTAEDQGGGMYVGNSGSAILTSTLLCTNLPNDLYESTVGNAVDNGGNCIGDCDDDDGDGVLNCNDDCPDDPNQTSDVDTDGDGTADCADGCPLDYFKTEPGLCGCGTADTDLDGDGLICDDPCPTWAGDCSEDGLTLYVAVGDSINDAIQGVIPGGTVVLLEGTHPIDTPVNPNGKAFTLRGELDAAGEPLTILSGQGLNRILECTSGETHDTAFTGLVFTAGQSTQGGALYCSNSSPAFDSCLFLSNSAQTGGAAYITTNSSGVSQPLFTDCLFELNTAFNSGASVYGGAIYAYGWSGSTHPQFVRCDFTQNTASGISTAAGSAETFGGVMALRYSSVTADQCTFSDNSAILRMTDPYVNDIYGYSYGGSIYAYGVDANGEPYDLVFSGCSFLRNSSEGYIDKNTSAPLQVSAQGGGVYFSGTVGSMSSCLFSENIATASIEDPADEESYAFSSAGAALIYGSDTKFNTCIFQNNQAGSGGAVRIRGSNVTSFPEFNDCVFQANSSSSGGGVYNSPCCSGDTGTEEVSPRFNNCQFLGNSASSSGGAFYNYSYRIDARPIFDECTFSGNTAGNLGGAVYNVAGGTSEGSQSEVELRNCTITANSAGNSGGAIYNTAFGDSTIGNISTVRVTNSQIEENAAPNGGAIYTSSNSESPGYPETLLLDTSVCANQEPQFSGPWTDLGNNCLSEICGDTDGDGTPNCDDDCPEDPLKTEPGFCGCGVPDEDLDGDGQLDCYVINVPEDYATIAEAIEAAPRTGRIILSPGTYQPSATLLIPDRSLTIEGAVDGKGMPLSVIDGLDSIRLFEISDNTNLTVLRNLEISRGLSTRGAGLYLSSSDCLVENCRFVGNHADYGSALYMFQGNLSLKRCTFLNNEASQSGSTDAANGQGGALSLLAGTVTAEQCEFTENRAWGGGWAYGGAISNRAALTIDQCSFNGNQSFGLGEYGFGGAIFNWPSDNTILTCLNTDFAANSTVVSGKGGAVYLWTGSNASFTNCHFLGNYSGGGAGVSSIESTTLFDGCTFQDNTALGGGAGIRIDMVPDRQVQILNSTITDNTSQQANEGGIYIYGDGAPQLSNNLICGNLIEQIAGPYDDLGNNCISEFCDSDQDGVYDCNDLCPGEPDIDSDSDGTFDCNDGCPFDPAKTDPGLCGCGVVDDDSDSDGDGVYDCNDQCPGAEDVDTDGDGIADCIDPCIEWPGDCSDDGQTYYVSEGQSIQIAIDLVPEGGFVVIVPGVFDLQVPLNLDGKPVTISGSLDEADRLSTVLDGGSASQLLHSTSGEGQGSVFVDLVFQNGLGVDGGAILIEKSSPRFERCGFRQNTAEDSGGAIFITQGSPSFIDCEFLDNEAADGGAIANEFNAFPTLTECVFSGNRAESGGAILNTFGSSPSLDGCRLEANEATGAFGGGGLWSSEITGSTPALADTTVCGNLPDQVVGGYADNGGNRVEPNCDDTECPTDLNGDGVTDGADLGIFFTFWDACAGCPADINGDGEVDGEDLGLLFVGWGPCG